MKPRTVLMTGCTSGIGRATALHLAAQGHRVFATGRNLKALEELAREAKGALHPIELDVTSSASVETARALVEQQTQGAGIDVLINNAGFSLVCPIELVDDAALRSVFETNVFGLVRVTRAFVPAMRARRSGLIINMSCITGRITFPFEGVYTASKHALESISDALRLELAPFGIRVTILEPGAVSTSFEATSSKTLELSGQQRDYASMMEAAGQSRSEAFQMVPGPAFVAAAIGRIVAARRPPIRVVTPLSTSFLLRVLLSLPDRWRDAVVAKIFGGLKAPPAASPPGQA
ncbi:SDR family oxidoreductase [Hyalangium versicolor]|uniref:SDR family oxidoreductase n=1 Tax=Hyalangium versicolor TaxID=2861190 RepID=UPI001CD033B0|nr:SDR family oxidoreductase [Hyalangium versicolor]